MIKSRTYIAVPPGETIKEQLADRKMTQKEFALRMNLSEKHVSHLLNGTVQLTPEVAYKLEMVLDVPASFWSNLEMIYREKLVKAELENTIEADKEIAHKFPYNNMVKNGWIDKVKSLEEKVVQLRHFFEVSSLTQLFSSSALIPAVSCRRLSITEKGDYALLTMVQKAKIEARNIELSSLNIDKLNKALPSLRKMTSLYPNEFKEDLQNTLAKCGVAIVFLENLTGSHLQGATFIDNNRVIIAMTTRSKVNDKFWFSLFHELGHIILGHLGSENIDEYEQQANKFATDTLIPQEDWDKFKANFQFDYDSIIEFAEKEEIDANIVVGRLQNEKYLSYGTMTDLRKYYDLLS